MFTGRGPVSHLILLPASWNHESAKVQEGTQPPNISLLWSFLPVAACPGYYPSQELGSWTSSVHQYFRGKLAHSLCFQMAFLLRMERLSSHQFSGGRQLGVI